MALFRKFFYRKPPDGLLEISESVYEEFKQNVLLMHCERGGWLVLAFMLAALLIYRKQYTEEHKTLDMIYKQAPRELLQLMPPLNPMPSQQRYLQYITRRNVGSEWPPLDRALTLDCIIIRFIPNMDREGGCRPIFRIYGQDPFMAADRTPKVLFSTPKRSKLVRHYKQVVHFFSQKPNRNRLKPHRTEPNGLVSFRFWLQNRTAPHRKKFRFRLWFHSKPHQTAPRPPLVETVCGSQNQTSFQETVEEALLRQSQSRRLLMLKLMRNEEKPKMWGKIVYESG